jgi:hypothetical protein
MPKKTKQYGWQCSECDKDPSEPFQTPKQVIDLSAPRYVSLFANVAFTEKQEQAHYGRYRTYTGIVFVEEESGFHFEPPRLHFEPRKLLNFDFNADPDADPAFHSKADPNTASKNNADPDPKPCLHGLRPCGSGSVSQ